MPTRAKGTRTAMRTATLTKAAAVVPSPASQPAYDTSTDGFVQLSRATWQGLRASARELGWIADGGDPTASQADRDIANLKGTEFGREKTRVSERLIVYLNKELSIQPPSAEDLQTSKAIATELARMRDVNVTATAVIKATTELLNLYNKS